MPLLNDDAPVSQPMERELRFSHITGVLNAIDRSVSPFVQAHAKLLNVALQGTV
jgi:hypothetical protein